MKNQRQAPRAAQRDWLIAVCLFLATVIVYGQVSHFAFLSFDDNQGLTGNPQVRDGVSWGGIVWAFTHAYTSNWIPMTWISHMLDFQFFGMDAGWHHLVNVVIHALSSAMLFAVLKRMTARMWESGFVAFVFALHPLHVESVAWLSERKDVLFAFFWMVTMWFYLDFVEKRTIGRYVLVVAAFCLGLLSKQMIVTLPFVLLLIDWWPLARSGWRQSALEKIPMVLLAAGASIVTVIVQRQGGAVQSFEAIPLAARAANALMAYVIYIANFVWPSGLAFFYPYPGHWPVGEVAFAGAALLAMSVLVVIARRTRPYLAVGWFWYLGTLLPVIGLIQVGYQSRADRYTYIPLIGISMMLAYEWPVASVRWPVLKKLVPAAAVAACAAWMFVTWVDISYWQDSSTLYQRAIAVTNENYLAHMNLGVDLVAQGRYPEGVRELFTAIEEHPVLPHARNSLGVGLYMLGRKDDAIEQFEQSIAEQATDAEPHVNLGNALNDAGRLDEATREFNTALKLNPEMANAHYGLGVVLVKENRREEAIPYFLEALRLRPDFREAKEQLRQLGR